MDDNEELVLEILSEIFGEPEKSYHNRLQYGYNCPECDDGGRKGNLEVSLEKHLFHCWSCGDINDMHGSLGKLIRVYGNKQHHKIYKVLEPEEFKVKERTKKQLKLPKGFLTFKETNPRYPIYKQAMNYLKSRGVTDEMINKFGIGFCGSGTHSNRIIIPSYTEEGDLNYYVARSWLKYSKVKYKNPEEEKDKIIFWEEHVDWNQDIYLVEGVFDGLFLSNSIPMLGKHLSTLLFDNLYKRAKKNIIICMDGDAWEDAKELYHTLNGGDLYGKIKIVKLPKDKDVCDLGGKIDEYYFEIK